MSDVSRKCSGLIFKSQTMSKVNALFLDVSYRLLLGIKIQIVQTVALSRGAQILGARSPR